MEIQSQPDRAQRRASRTHRRLLDAALAMFSRKGADATTIEDITERADVGKGTFYRHFENKEAVLTALAEEAVDHLVQRLEARGTSHGLEEALDRLLGAHVASLSEEPDEFLLVFQGRLLLRLEREGPEGGLEEPYRRYLEEIAQRVSPFLPPGAEETRLRRLAGALTRFASGFFAFTMIGLSPQGMEASIEPLRREFVVGLSSFLRR